MLLAFDHRLSGPQGLAVFAARAPRLTLDYLEFAYLLCYAVVPAGWAWLLLAGHQNQSEEFWTTVLLASFSCYGVLPWLPSRAPRAVERPRYRDGSRDGRPPRRRWRRRGGRQAGWLGSR